MASMVVTETKTQPETKSQKGAATRDQILNAASRLIHVQGYQSTSLDDVLRESGVGKGNFYYYFKSKEDLGYAIIDRIGAPSSSAASEPAFADADADRVGQLHCLLRPGARRRSGSATAWAAARWAISPPSSPTCTRGSAQQLAGIFDVYRDHLAEAIRRGQRSGRLRPDADAARVAQFLVAALEGAILLAKVTRDITVMERCVEELKAHLALYRNRA